MDLADKILRTIEASPGIKAKDVATRLGIDRAAVNSVLYGSLRHRATQDSSYRWWPKGKTNIQQTNDQVQAQIDTPLARLCRYYLDCLNHDDQGGLSVFASSQFDLDYVEIDSATLLSGDSKNIFSSDGAHKLLRKVRRDRGRLVVVLGYPVQLTWLRARTGSWQGFKVEPILLFGFDEDPIDRSSLPSLSNDLPQINFKAIKSLTSPDNPSIVEEVVQLSEELGLANLEAQFPELDEIIPRLGVIRPEWDWQEDPDPNAVKSQPALAELSKAGIYNRAILVVAERSPYTRGLETELGKLQALSEHKYANTALGAWIRGDVLDSPTPPAQPLIEVLPLNTEQRQAVLQGLNNPMTVITGPPGTGKSQVVTSLLINGAWQQKRILFASKNNKAVDVVDTRVNALGPRPIMLRLGANQYQSRLAEYLISLLAASTTIEDEQQYNDAIAEHGKIQTRFAEFASQLDETIKLRNTVDQLEQSVETIRSEVGSELFRQFRSFERAALQQPFDTLAEALRGALRTEQPFLQRIVWPILRKTRYERLRNAVANFRVGSQLGISLPEPQPSEITIDEWASFVSLIERRIEEASKVSLYFKQLDALKAVKPLEQITVELQDLIEKLAEASEFLWDKWLRLQPKRLSQTDRRLLKEYSSLLQMIVSSNESGRQLGRQVFAKYHSLFPQITNILGCWAVTSLSARGRIPFEPGFFDLLIIDEASQCDLASALPLLYRAKQAVIIGDPKQLRHISSLSRLQDQHLLEKHDLVEDSSAWAYSVNSLFDLAAGLCRSEDIVSLRDHHRSHADIIEFSNRHFYEGRLRVATKYSRLRFPKEQSVAVRWVDVSGPVLRPPSGGALNEREAQAVVREIERLLVHQRYQGSIGVVSPFRAQANRIRELAFQSESLVAHLAAAEFLADTVHRFQGDERDIMIFSPVVSTNMPKGGFTFLRNNTNLFNVAITRARCALIVVGDREAALNSDVDYLSLFAKYVSEIDSRRTVATTTESNFGPQYPSVSQPDRVSDWERVLYRTLFAAGVRPIPQYDLEKYTLDFAVFDGERRLNIEVDGERYHRNWDGELCRRDQIRNQRLIELGWDVKRFWVYQVRDDLASCVDWVCNWKSKAPEIP